MAAAGFFMRFRRRSKAQASAIEEQDAVDINSMDGPSLFELWQKPRRCSSSLRSRLEVAPI